MTEDLHDIDDLFREGLEGHEEEVSPSVWKGVSNDLDKKQASYYKSKYYRLKRAAVVLLVLCFLGSAYVVVDVMNKKQTPIVQKENNETAPSLEEKKKSNSTVDNKSNNEQKTEQKEKTVTTNDTTSDSFKQLTTETPTGVLKKPTVPNVPSIHSTSPVADNVKPKETFLPNDGSSNQKEKQPIESPSSTQQLLSQLSSFSLPLLPLTGKDYSTPTIHLQTSFVHRKSILSSNNTNSISESKVKTAHSFSLTVFAAPNFSFDRLEDDDHLAGPGRNRQAAHREEQRNISFSSGLLLHYELTKSISLQSGIALTSSSTSIAPKTVYAKADNNGHTLYELHCSSGYAYISSKGSVQPAVGDSAKTSGTTSKLMYVSIPASVSYRISKGRFSLYPTIGAGLNILTSGKTNTNLTNTAGSESTTTSITGLKSTYVDGQVSVGIEYDLSKKLAIGIHPNARMAITPINKETPVKSYQNFLSVETGVRIKL